MSPGNKMLSPKSMTSERCDSASSFHSPTLAMRLPEMITAPSSMGGREMGRTTRARRIMNSPIGKSSTGLRHNHPRRSPTSILSSAFFLPPSSRRCFLPGAFGARGDFMFARLVLALAFADLLLDLFFHQINGRVEVAFAILGEQIGAAHGEP